MFWNTGGEAGVRAGDGRRRGRGPFRPLVGRGCAYADIDGNGTLDVLLMENGGPARLLRNDGGTGHHWIRLTLTGDGKRCNTSAIGVV